MSLAVTQLIGFGVGGAAVSLAYVSTAASTAGTGGSSKTFTAQSIGSGTTADHILVSILTNDGGSNSRTISSVTVDGNAATSLVAASQARFNAALYIIQAPAGTTSDIVINMSGAISSSGGQVNWMIGVYRLTNLATTTPVQTNSSNATSGTADVSLSAPGTGVIVACGITKNTSAAWSGMTSSKDFQYAPNNSTMDASGVHGVASGSSVTINYGSITSESAVVSAALT